MCRAQHRARPGARSSSCPTCPTTPPSRVASSWSTCAAGGHAGGDPRRAQPPPVGRDTGDRGAAALSGRAHRWAGCGRGARPTSRTSNAGPTPRCTATCIPSWAGRRAPGGRSAGRSRRARSTPCSVGVSGVDLVDDVSIFGVDLATNQLAAQPSNRPRAAAGGPLLLDPAPDPSGGRAVRKAFSLNGNGDGGAVALPAHRRRPHRVPAAGGVPGVRRERAAVHGRPRRRAGARLAVDRLLRRLPQPGHEPGRRDGVAGHVGGHRGRGQLASRAPGPPDRAVRSSCSDGGGR